MTTDNTDEEAAAPADDTEAVEPARPDTPAIDVSELPETMIVADPLANSEGSAPRGFTRGDEYEVTETIHRVADGLPPVQRTYTKRV